VKAAVVVEGFAGQFWRHQHPCLCLLPSLSAVRADRYMDVRPCR
jgi:hypothetical protein